MKKIGDKNFWIILSLSIITLIALTIGVIFLTRKSSKEFYSAGYIINSTTTKSDKYYFNDNTIYKENVFGEYTFKDVDNKEVSTSKDNFIHYLDNSLSFMKNGVILDLDNFNEKIVPYYNITDKIILKYNNGGYTIETNDKTLVFGNILGRITDNKYIILGSDIRIKLSGNEEPVKGKYFELLFVEDGIVKVENNEGSYQTTTEGTTIFVGDDIKIDLGTKKVFYGEEEKLTLDEMTIDGNENIDIDTSKVKEENKGNSSDSNNNTNNQENNNGNKPIDTDKNENNNNNGTNGEETVEIKKEVSVDLVKALVDINSLNATIQVIDTANAIKGNLVLTLYDVDNNKTTYTKILSTSSDLQEVVVNSLTPNTNYYMSVKDSEDYEYLARNFITSSLDLSLKREMVTTNSVSYSVDFSNDDNIKSATVSLYNEKNEIINSYTIDNGNDTSIEFSGLESNKTYSVILDNVIFKNTSYSKIYTINSSVQTLKEKPTIGNISVKANEENKTFELIMEKPEDKDKSIQNYIYKIYDVDTLEENNIDTIAPVYTFSTINLKNEVLKLGENGLQTNKNYVYKVTVRYYDNYKENEIDTSLSGPFIIAGLPTITFEEKEIDFNSVHLLLTLKDEGCTVPIPGRSCYDDTNGFIIKYRGGRDTENKYISNITFDPETLTYDLKVSGLSENTTYTFEVWGNYDLHNDKGLQINKILGTYQVTTAGMESLTMSNWKLNNYSNELPISVNTELIATIPSSTIIDKLDSFKIKLYKGSDVSGELLGSYDVIGNDNIKTNYYNKSFNINSSQFGITDINNLREVSGGKLSRYYTIEIADAYDSDKTNKFNIQDNTFKYEIPAILLLEDEVSSPEVIVEEITKKQAESGEYGDFNALGINKYLSSSTVVGYKVTANFDKNKIQSYFQGDNPIVELNFYANMEGKTIEKKTINFSEDETYTTYFFLKDGTDYNTIDNDLRRGNTYTFSMDLSLDTNNDKEIDTSYPNKKPTSIAYTSTKEEPRINMYVDSSTSNSITYKYTVIDYDNALVKEEDKYLIYYTVGESEEEYTTEISNTASMETFTISNLINNTIYNLSYKKALTKRETPNSINFKYYFDGYHDAKEYNLGYDLKYYDFDNEITLILNDNEFINRISAYLVTLTTGSLKYQEVISNLSDCGENKCIKIDYAKIKDFKGKETTVTLEAFYDNGIAGFSSKSLLGDYFKNLGLVDNDSASKVGFIYQEVGNTAPGKYYYIYRNSSNRIESVISETPKGILGIDAKIYKESNKTSTLTTSNMVDITKNTFINYGEISLNSDVDVLTNGIKLKSHNIYITPKVLDKVEIQTTNNKFKFTSIIPKVSTTITPLINGAVMDISLSIDTDTLETDYVKTDGKYKFYIDIYTKDEENNLILVKTVETDYENLTNISFAGLNPDSTYYYKISADMNKNGTKVKTPLFAQGKNGYIEYIGTLKTLGKEDILKSVEYSHNSQKGETVYSSRTLKVTTGLKSKENFNVKYELYDINNVLEKEGIVLNEDITSNSNAIFTTDISGNDFVFGGDYHRLVITAVTIDAEPKTLELYNDKLKQTTLFNELKKPNITLNQSTGIDEVTGEYDYYISYNIVIEDTDRVIEGGKVNIELEDSTYTNACPNAEDCKVEVDLFNLTCNSNGTNSRIKSCSVTENTANNKFTLNITYNKLEADTNYFIYIYSDIYRNNLSLTNKEEVVYVRKGQYTRSELNFSLGSPTLTAKENKLIMTFVGSTNVPDSIKGIEYNVNEEGAGKISSGMMGLIPSGTSSLVSDATNYGDIIYTLDKDGYPYIEIPIPEGKTLGKTNFITITYYYEENGNLIKLSINGKTVQQYYVKDVS
ncbi:MAG: hypothetical protein ACI310_04805 [Bacilli bacterium]